MKKLFSKKICLIIIVILLAAGGGVWDWQKKSAATDLAKVRAERPELSSFVDDIERLLAKKVPDDKRVTYYLDLGLAWKSLADRTLDASHYQEALKVYEAGINFTRRTNTVLLINAGNMAIYVKDYDQARQYYEEVIRVAPGDPDGYTRLADLHKNYFRSSPETIMAIYDQGIARMPAPDILIKQKEGYAKSLGIKADK